MIIRLLTILKSRMTLVIFQSHQSLKMVSVSVWENQNHFIIPSLAFLAIKNTSLNFGSLNLRHLRNKQNLRD